MILEKIYNSAPIRLQNVMCSVKGWLVCRRRYNKDFFAQLDLFENHKVDPDEELHNFFSLVEHVPAYKEVFKTGKKVSLNDFPIINKQYVKDHYEEFLNRNYAGPTITVHTSGTTGNSLEVIQSCRFEHKQWAVWWRYREELGIKFGTWYGWFGCGEMIVPIKQDKPPFWRVDLAGRRIMFGTYHLNIGNVEIYAEEIARRRLRWLHGNASRIYYLSRLIVEKRLSPVECVEFVTTASENLPTYCARVIQRAFPRALVRNHYGQTEGVANFSQMRNGEWRIDEDFAKVELIPITPSDPSRCRIVGTNFSNPVLPLIRYDMGDIALVRWENGKPHILGIEGRENEQILLKNGMLVNSMFNYDIFGDAHNVREAQVRVINGEEVELLVVRALQYDIEDEKAILGLARKYLKDDIKLSICYTERIPRAASGKFRAVVKTDAPFALSNTNK